MTSTNIPKIAAAYIRVSTDEQVEQSPESQLIEIRKYAAAHGLVLPDDNVYMDEGISGKRSENRPAFQAMIGAAKDDPAPFDVILLWKFSRFARNQEESIVYKALLRKQCNVDVVSVSEPLPEGHFASLIERIIEWFDEFYSIRLAQEVKRSMTVKASRGELQSGPAFGYRSHMEPGKKTVLVPFPEEAELVRQIFDRFNGGEGTYQIARWLNALGATTRYGKAFESRTVEYILRNPVYIGKLRWTPTGKAPRHSTSPDTIIADSAHEALVSQETFDAAQVMMAQQKAKYGYNARPAAGLRDWMSGLVRCSECGGTLLFQKPHYFKCSNYNRGKCRSSQYISVSLLHEAIIQQLDHDINAGVPLDYTVIHANRERSGELFRLHATLSDLQRRDSRLLDAYLSGALSLEQFSTAKASLDKSTQETQALIADAESASASSEDTAAILIASLKKTRDTLAAPDALPEDKNDALRDITERIVFNKAAWTLDITYRLIL